MKKEEMKKLSDKLEEIISLKEKRGQLTGELNNFLSGINSLNNRKRNGWDKVVISTNGYGYPYTVSVVELRRLLECQVAEVQAELECVEEKLSSMIY